MGIKIGDIVFILLVFTVSCLIQITLWSDINEKDNIVKCYDNNNNEILGAKCLDKSNSQPLYQRIIDSIVLQLVLITLTLVPYLYIRSALYPQNGN